MNSSDSSRLLAVAAGGAAAGFGAAYLLWGRKRCIRAVAPARYAGMCKLRPEMYDQYTQVRSFSLHTRLPQHASASFCG